MKAAVHRFARRMWQGEAGVSGAIVGALLLPLELLWRAVTVLRNRRYDRGAGTRVHGLAVVSVGNLAVGGTGKTPLAGWICRALGRLGIRPALLHGGYGDDEPLLHRRWSPDVPVLVDRDRVRAAGAARGQGVETVVLDDGFQHRGLARDLDLVVLAVEDPFPGPVLPRGPYREPASALARADAVVLTRRTAGASDARRLAGRVRAVVPDVPVVACVHLRPGSLRPLTVPAVTTPSDDATRRGTSPVGPMEGAGGILALTAVGRPDAVRSDVAEVTGAEVELLAHPDHHPFSASDAVRARARAGARPIVVTEKDAVKLERHATLLGDAWVVDQELIWDWGEDALLDLLADLRAHPGTRGAGG